MSKSRNIADLGSNDVIETSATGVDVTGTITADGLTVDGAASITNASDTPLTIAYNASNSSSYGYYQIINNNTGNPFEIHTGGTKTLNLGSNGDVHFYEDTGTTAKFVWDASAESLGIGTASPSAKFQVKTATGRDFRIDQGTANKTTLSNDYGLTLKAGSGYNLDLDTGNASGAIRFLDNGSERARIDSSGNLLVGTTTGGVRNLGAMSFSAGTSSYSGVLGISHSTNNVNGSGFVNFSRDNAYIGSITQSGTTGVSYNTSSDERLKENIKDTTHSVNIDDIQVREYDWKSDGSHQRYGFIAQELETVYPEAVHSPEDEDEMKSVDYSKLVPLLVKEIQTLKARIETLENK